MNGQETHLFHVIRLKACDEHTEVSLRMMEGDVKGIVRDRELARQVGGHLYRNVALTGLPTRSTSGRITRFVIQVVEEGLI